MIKVIKEVTKEEFKDFLFNIDLNDKNIYSELNKASFPIFQFSGGTADKVTNMIKPTNFNEMVAINCMARPGSINFAPEYKKNKEEGVRKYPKIISDLLEETHGAILMQEQIMKIFNVIGGFSLEETNYIRSLLKKLGKKDKKKEDLEAWDKAIERFKINSQKLGLTDEEVKVIAADLLQLAEYSFCKAHAVAYTYVAVQTLYLSYYFKPAFYAAVLSTKSDEDLLNYMFQIKAQGIDILPPDVNKSKEHFYSINNNAILYGLTDVKFIGDNPTKKIIENRPYNNLFEFIMKTRSREVSSRVIEALISVGCFDFYDKNRKKLSVVFKDFWEKKKAIKIEEKLKVLWDSIEKEYNSIPQLSLSQNEIVSLEKEFFGFRFFTSPFSKDLINILYKMASNDMIYLSFDEIENKSKKTPVIVDDVRILVDKNGNEMAFLSITDLHENNISIPLFASFWKFLKNDIKKDKIYLFNLFRDKENNIKFGNWGKFQEDIVVKNMIRAL